MAQIVYLGMDSDFTQEIGLMVARIASKAKIVEGLGITVQDGSQGQVLMAMQPGIFIMPDGMVVKETEVVLTPISNIDSSQEGYTIYAKRYLSDSVYYDIVVGYHYQDTIQNAVGNFDPNLVLMPLAFIKLNSGQSIGAAAYTVTNLGNRGQVTYTHLPAPIQGFYQKSTSPMVNTFNDGMLFSNLQPSNALTPVVSYLQIFAPDNQFLKAVTPIGRRYRENGTEAQVMKFSLRVTSSNLKAQPTFINQAIQNLVYEDPEVSSGVRPLLYKTFIYPVGSKVTKDLLTIEVINQDALSGIQMNTTPFELNEIILSTLGIFG